MANDQPPDFDDLLAAFDIPDVPQLPIENDEIQEPTKKNEKKDQILEKPNKSFDNLPVPLSLISLSQSISTESKSSETKTTNIKNIEETSKPLTVLIPLNTKPSEVISLPVFQKVSSPTNEVAKNNIPPKTTTSSTSLFSLTFTPTVYTTAAQSSKPQLISNSVYSKSIPSSSSSAPVSASIINNLITSRVLPPYKAPSPPKTFNIKIPIGGYRCLDCYDVFSLEASLSEHLQRRSMQILINCEHCDKQLTFYNRCRLLEHCRYHKNRNESLDLTKCKISSIAQDTIITSVPNFVEINPANHSQINGVKISTNQEEIPKHKCLECFQMFENSRDLEDHFGRGQMFAVSGNKCNTCHLMCPTKCSLWAHQRIHARQTPYSCPECGQIVDDDWQAFQHHLRIKCMHFSRTVGYKCPSCFVIYHNMALLRSHILTSHSESYYKCQGCPMAFKVVANFEQHQKQTHTNCTVSFKLIFKCPMCDTVFNSNDQLHGHLDIHLRELAKSCLYMFKCLECYKLLDNKALLADHMQTFHSQSALKEICMICGSLFQTKQALNKHHQLLHPEKNESTKSIQVLIKCEECQLSFPSPNSLVAHKKRSHLFKCSACSGMFKYMKDLSEHGKQHLEAGLFICLLCSNRVLASRETLAKHLLIHSADAQNEKPCRHCNATFADKKEMLNHLKNIHFLAIFSCPKCEAKFDTVKGQDRHIQIYHEGRNQRHACWLCKGKDFSKRVLLKRHIVTIHKIPLEEIDYSKLYKNNRKQNPIFPKLPVIKEALKRPNENIPAISTKKLRIDGEILYHCAKCSFSSESSANFQEHILQHKNTKNTVQCQECGACFVVESALRKHLFIIHKIRNNINMEESGSSKDSSKDSHSDSQEVNGATNVNSNPLECNVCYRTFDDDASLKTHMRTHGMAFIRSKRFTTPVEYSGNS